ncbi:MAG: O-antigen ligase family protein [Tissierellia bacterium]|nr:O-antigen ligase family protein [Tissierellia bacterium]
MIGTIKNLWEESFLYQVLLSLYGLMEGSFLFRLGQVKKRGKRASYLYYSSWACRGIDRLWGGLNRVFAFLHSYYARSFFSLLVEKFRALLAGSRIFGFLKARSGFENGGDLLVLVPTLYLLVDFFIRRLPLVNRFGSVWDELVLVGLFFYLFCRGVYQGGLPRVRSVMGLPVLLFILLGITHLLIKHEDPAIAIEGFRAMFQQMFWFFIFIQMIRDKKNLPFLMRVLSFLGLFLGLHACYQYVAGVPMLGNWTDVTESVRTRAYSIVGSPNILGALFVILLPMSFYKVFEDRGLFRWLHVLAVGSMFFGLLFTFSRGAWLSFMVVFLILIFLMNKRLFIPFSYMGLLVLLTDNPISQRFLHLFSKSYVTSSSKGGRLYRWGIGYRMWERDRIFGQGLGRFGGAVAINNGLAPFYLDNYYLKTLVEMGLFGMVYFVIFVVWLMVFGYKVISEQEGRLDVLRAVCIYAGALGVLVQNAVENIFEVPAMMIIFFLYIALLEVLKAPHKEEEEDPSQLGTLA